MCKSTLFWHIIQGHKTLYNRPAELAGTDTCPTLMRKVGRDSFPPKKIKAPMSVKAVELFDSIIAGYRHGADMEPWEIL
jgi:hypothetical protein